MRIAENSLRLPLINKPAEENVSEVSGIRRFFNYLLLIVLAGMLYARVLALTTQINEVHMEFKYNHQFFYDDPIFVLDFSGLVSLFWNATCYFMSILIVLGTSVLPGVSLILLICFILEQNHQFLAKSRPNYRYLLEGVVCLLEWLAKFSLVDIMVQSIIQKTIYTDATLLDFPLPSFREGEVGLSLNAMPKTGILMSIISTILLIMSFRFVHKVNFKTKETFLMRHIKGFKRYFCCLTSSQCRSGFTKFLIINLTVLNMYALYMAFSSELLKFKLKGIAGSLLRDKDAVKVYVPLEIPDFVLNTATPDESMLSTVLGIFYFVAVLLMPVMYSVMAFVWILSSFGSDSIGFRGIMKFTEMVLDASLSFSNLEVLLVAAIAGFIEMPIMARFMLIDKFPVLCNFIHDSDDKLDCVDLEANIEVGFYWLVLAIVLKQITVGFIYFKRA